MGESLSMSAYLGFINYLKKVFSLAVFLTAVSYIQPAISSNELAKNSDDRLVGLLSSPSIPK
jgi:hypothetical protein